MTFWKKPQILNCTAYCIWVQVIPQIIEDQFYTMRNLQRSPIAQTSNWFGTYFCCFIQQTASSFVPSDMKLHNRNFHSLQYQSYNWFVNNRHVLDVHVNKNIKPFKCTMCSFCSHAKRYLLWHVRRHHDPNNPPGSDKGTVSLSCAWILIFSKRLK